MLRAFVISGMLQENKTIRPVAAVYFDDKKPTVESLGALGFRNAEITEAARPVGYDKQPTEPTVYIYDRPPTGKPPSGKKTEILIIRLDANGVETNREAFEAEPQVVIPKISGVAANTHLYPPAFAFLGTVKQGIETPVSGVLFIDSELGITPDAKTFKCLGITIKTIERVSLEGAAPGNMLYMFGRPIAISVQTITLKVDSDGRLARNFEGEVKGDPETLIPAISGGALTWLYRRPSSIPPARISAPPAKISSIPPAVKIGMALEAQAQDERPGKKRGNVR